MSSLKVLKGVDPTQIFAFFKKVGNGNAEKGREVFDDVLGDKLKLLTEKIVKALFDKHGRCIPVDLKGRVNDANLAFGVKQPGLSQKDLVLPISRLEEHLRMHTDITSSKVLQRETKRLLKLIADNPATANLLKGICLPIICPEFNCKDYKDCLRAYMTAVRDSYEQAFSKRPFYPQGGLELWDHGGTRADRLLELVNAKSIIGLYFPNALQGFSVNASREQIGKLPEGFILSGMDILMAMIMYPDVLAFDDKSPNLCMAALSYGRDQSVYFDINTGSLHFKSTSLNFPDPTRSSGLFFTG